MFSKLAWLLLGAFIGLVCADASYAASSSPMAPGCYVIVDPKDEPNLDNAQEVLCLDASGHAVVRESSSFGEGIKGCNVVTMTSQRDEFTVDIDYRKCTNNSPSHKLVCRAKTSSGVFACIDKAGSRKEDETLVKLAPLPPDR